MDLYTELRQISAVRFHEIKFTGEIYLVDKAYDGSQVYNISQIIEINDAWLQLYDKYYEKSDDNRLRSVLKNKKKNLKLLININILEIIISSLELIRDNEGYIPDGVELKTLSSFKNSLKTISAIIKFEAKGPIEQNIQWVTGYCSGLKTRHQLLFRDDMNVGIQDLLEYYELKANIEEILKKDNIPDHINMLQWIAYEKRAKIRLKHGRQHNQRFGRRKATV
ncbi:MAG: hypothetical protein ACUZ8H_01400 [Candidatus Anammoxibacter sp.]